MAWCVVRVYAKDRKIVILRCTVNFNFYGAQQTFLCVCEIYTVIKTAYLEYSESEYINQSEVKM